MTPQDQDLIQKRQRSRAAITGWLLGAFAVLVFAIALVKIGQGAAH